MSFQGCPSSYLIREYFGKDGRSTMKLVLLGAPGVGKGTIAEPLSKRLGIPTISTGEIFRQNISENTSLGQMAKKYIDNGELVPDDVVLLLIESRLIQADCANGFILDGFPRTIVQAKAFDEMLKKRHEKITAVVNIELDEKTIITRLAARRVCGKCGHTYSINFSMPAASGVCDDCGGHVTQREDDKAETVKKRLEIYRKKTQPLVEYYENAKLLVRIQNMQEPGESVQKIIDAISKIL